MIDQNLTSAWPRGRDELLEQTNAPCHHRFRSPVGVREGAGTLTEGRIAPLQNLSQRGHKSLDRSRGADTDTCLHEVPGVGFILWNDDWHPARHGLLNRQREAFPVRGQDQAIGRVILLVHVLGAHELAPRDVLRSIAQKTPQRPVTEHEEMDPRQESTHGDDEGESFLLDEPPDEEYDLDVSGQLEMLSSCPALRDTRRTEALGVDTDRKGRRVVRSAA